jgi:MFS superfamily sulfate permease-like transporter
VSLPPSTRGDRTDPGFDAGIPNAALSAVIIHAVIDLIASPRQVYGFWKISPLEAIIWAAAVIVTVVRTLFPT